jgi:methylated-DNA-protein-cysteine methyltransferase related protein
MRKAVTSNLPEMPTPITPASYRRLVRGVVASIPPGRVMAYGAIAGYLAEVTGRASPRLVGQVMARHGDGVPWHRVVRADGQPARGHEARALRRLRDEGTPLARGGLRVDMGRGAWSPDRPPGSAAASGADAGGDDAG